VQPELAKKLTDKYPEIFSTSFDYYGFECGDGWYSIIDSLCSAIVSCRPAEDIPMPIAAQVKEKFGGLRFYVDWPALSEKWRGDSGNTVFARQVYHTTVHSLIDMAEEMSFCVCEDCGMSGPDVKRVGGGWIRTLCPTHAAEYTK
jgi:hypothetical protein